MGGGCCLSTIVGFGLVACFCGWLLFNAGLGDVCGFVGVYCGRFSWVFRLSVDWFAIVLVCAVVVCFGVWVWVLWVCFLMGCWAS